MGSSLTFPNEQPSKQASIINGEQKQEDIMKKYKDILSTLPKETVLTMDFFQLEGFWYTTLLAEAILWAQENFKARSTDIILASYPKCGTTWLKALMFAIKNRNQYYPPDLDDHDHSSTHPLHTKNPHNLVPYLELKAYEDDPISYLESLPSPRLLATHMAFSSLPKSITSSGAKIVIIIRDPKDVFVSEWIFRNKIRSGRNMPTVPVEVAFENFCRGVCQTGPFWDYTLGYWRAHLESPDNVLFLRFEDMKKDTCFHVKKLAEFMRHPFSMEEENKGAVEDIIKICSFGNLSNLEENNTGTYHVGNSGYKVPNNAFFRRGVVGDWKNHLTSEMIKHLDAISEEKFKGTELILTQQNISN